MSENLNALDARLQKLEKTCDQMAGTLDRLLTNVDSIKSILEGIAEKQMDNEKLIKRIDAFDMLMNGAKATQQTLAAQIASIHKNGEEIMKRFDNYDAMSTALRETQKKLASEISLIASKIEKFS